MILIPAKKREKRPLNVVPKMPKTLRKKQPFILVDFVSTFFEGLKLWISSRTRFRKLKSSFSEKFYIVTVHCGNYMREYRPTAENMSLFV